jgi:drug/metabolite transporter (DMT)-like permease
MEFAKRWERPARLAAAALLLIAFLFPLARCSQQDPRAPRVEPPVYKYYYAWTDFDAGSFWSWALLLAFFWPVPVLLLEHFHRKEKPPGPAFPLLQPLLALLAGYAVFRETVVKELWIGGYLAYAGLGVYFLASLAPLAEALARRRRARR